MPALCIPYLIFRKILRLIVLFIESLESRADAVRAVCRVFPPVFLNIKGKRVGKVIDKGARTVVHCTG